MEFVLGVDIGGTDVKLGIVASDGEVTASGAIPTRADEGPEAVAKRAGDWLAANATTRTPVVAAGVDCAGLVDREQGMLHCSPNLAGWIDVPLARIFEERLSCPVIIENDVNAAAYAEFAKGAGRGCRNFVCMTLGTGVGGGIVIEGKLYRGSSGFAGEIGHTVIQVDGPPCGCGNRGCIEAFVGARAILDRARSMAAASGGGALAAMEPLTVKAVAQAASDGDAVAVKALAETGRFLGVGLTNLVHLFNPEAIAIGGGVAGAGSFILEPARETLRAMVMDPVLASVRIVPAALGNAASFIGAALLAQPPGGRC